MKVTQVAVAYTGKEGVPIGPTGYRYGTFPVWYRVQLYNHGKLVYESPEIRGGLKASDPGKPAYVYPSAVVSSIPNVESDQVILKMNTSAAPPYTALFYVDGNLGRASTLVNNPYQVTSLPLDSSVASTFESIVNPDGGAAPSTAIPVAWYKTTRGKVTILLIAAGLVSLGVAIYVASYRNVAAQKRAGTWGYKP